MPIVVPFVPLPLFNEKVTKRVRHAFHLTKDKGKAKNNSEEKHKGQVKRAPFCFLHLFLFPLFIVL